MKQITFKISDFVGREIDQGFVVLRRLRDLGVPVIGDGWPWAVTSGVLEMQQDALWGTCTFTWHDLRSVDLASFDKHVSLDVFQWSRNDFRKGLYVLQELREAGVPVFGQIWPWSVESGVLVSHGFDVVFGNLNLSWKA
jgi:hypothetical protein